GIDKAWEVLGHGFADAYIWASAVNHSAGTGTSFNGASCSERGCDIAGMGKTKEKLIKYSDAEHLLSYTVPEGMPSIVKYATNTWQILPVGKEKSKLTMEMEITLGGFMGIMMQPIMKMMMNKMGNTLIQDFKFYVENDRPSEAKIRAFEKLKKTSLNN
ncbi:MAG: SRPBCC family protein, partial [Flavobacterium sp.]|uniref:SRPBCC family protein n=1 Tax=Flavobacterium sp. TaxID=239 RepID=UPI0026248F3D